MILDAQGLAVRLRQQIRRAEFIPSKKDLQSEVPDFHASSTGCSMTMPSPPQHRIPHAGRQSVELKDRPAETKRMRRSVLSGSGRRAAQTGNECGEGLPRRSAPSFAQNFLGQNGPPGCRPQGPCLQEQAFPGPACQRTVPSPDDRAPSAGPPCARRSAAATSAGASANGPGRGTDRPRAWCTG